MAINWEAVQKAIFPIKNFDDVCQRLRESFGYWFVHDAYNFSLPELSNYTQNLLGGDPRGRYSIYNSRLKSTISGLYTFGIENLVSLKDHTASREHLELLVDQCGIPAGEIAMVLKYLIYWVVPANKYLGGLIQPEPDIQQDILKLREFDIRSNLDMLQAGTTPAGRKVLADKTKISLAKITGLVNRADFSRLPWASKATISNIIGAGYLSLIQLANADPEQLVTDFFRYGKSIGKNLKLGNEIESSYRIAKILPQVIKED